jgi:hypothetical protein
MITLQVMRLGRRAYEQPDHSSFTLAIGPNDRGDGHLAG